MRKNKTSNKYALKLSIVTIGVGATIGAIAQNSTGNSVIQNVTQTATSVGNTVSSAATAVGNTVGAAANNVANQAGSVISGAVGAIQQGGDVQNSTQQVGAGGSVVSSGTQTAATSGSAITAVIPQYTAEQLSAAGCDAGVWAKMVADYQGKAAQIIALDNEQITRQLVKATPPITAMAGCFEQAANIINSATAIYTTITKLLTGGGLDSNQLLTYGKDLLTKYACSLVDSYIASTGITGTLNGINNLPNTVLGTNVGVGGINTNVGGILQGGGYQQGQGSSVGQVTGGQIAGSITNAIPSIPGISN